ncbi:MAG: RNA pseudouridine synthase [Bacteroidetes bacterium]|nr:RNA pseudouridine synthase [Bacteroidota bacterium]
MKKINLEKLILFEDQNYLALNKPPMISTIPDRIDKGINILKLLRNKYPEIKVCHRLDKETSGVILFAKNKEAQTHLSNQFYRREINKEYHAVVKGQHQFNEETVRGAIYYNGNKAYINIRKGKKAKTLFYTKKIFEGFTLLSCKPITGRTHQIRIHAACRKASLIGDYKYKGEDIYLSQLKRNYKPKKETEELPIIKRIALHSKNITFNNIDNKNITIEAPYPKDFNILLKSLEKHSNVR